MFDIGQRLICLLLCYSDAKSFLYDTSCGIVAFNLEDEFDSSTEIGEYTWTVTHQKLH